MQASDSIPARIASRPRDNQGRHTAWYAYTDSNNAIDYNVFRCEAIDDAIRFGRCWCCGGQRGRYSTYIASPAVVIDGESNEPPSHGDCALHAASNCPFLTSSQNDGRRRVIALYTTTRPPMRIAPGGNRFWIGPPVSVRWFSSGRAATPAEARDALDATYQAMLSQAAESDTQVDKLEKLYRKAIALLPAESPLR